MPDTLLFLAKSLRSVTIGNVQVWRNTLEGVAPLPRAHKVPANVQ
jgi:hypothetical protein